MNPLIYAFLGAVSASLGTLFAKMGLKGVDSNTLTVVRGIVMAVIVTISAFMISKFSFSSLSSLTTRNWIFVILSAAGGAFSWLFFYYALAHGNVVSVTVIDKLSIVITALLVVIFLSEKISISSSIGIIMIVLGSILVAMPIDKILGLFK